MTTFNARVIVSTCGTSFLTNGASDAERRLLAASANKAEAQLTSEERRAIDERAARREAEGLDLLGARRASAEVNALVALYGDRSPGASGAEDVHYLIVTDTYQGRRTAELVAGWLRGQGVRNVQLQVVPDLVTDDVERFRSAMGWLVSWCDETLVGYRERRFRVVFNLTGGFKALQGYMQVLGTFYADESVYLFETVAGAAPVPIVLPRLPLRITPEEAIREHLSVFRRLSHAGSLAASEAGGVPEVLLERVGEEVALSTWGQLVWSRLKDEAYSERLLEPLSGRLRFGRKFADAVGELPPDRRRLINLRMDQLSGFLDHGRSRDHNPDSLNFKPVQGTRDLFECYAWSDQDAKRIYGRFDGEVFVVEELGKHL